MTLLGADISHYQGTPDFRAAKAAGLSFVFLKATEGTNYTDPTLNTNRNNAKAAGLVTGYYHFARNGDPVAEATQFCNAVGTLAAGELAALDWEVAGANPPAWSKVWLDTVAGRLGVKPLIYMNKSAEAGSDWTPVVRGDYGLWLANYDFSATNPMPSVKHWPFVAIEQYSDRAQITGIVGGVDADVFQGTAETLAKYGKQGAPAPAPTPTPPPPPPAPTPPPAWDVRSWRAHEGATGQIFVNLQNWANRMYPAYCHIAPTAPSYGPQTARFLAEFCRRQGVASDGNDIGPRTAQLLYNDGFRG